ncbi:MAG: PEP-CTERM sorting domain-containing protein [Aquabacterium sp.]
MKASFKPVLLASAFLMAAATAQAAEVSVSVGADTISGNTTFSALTGTGTLAFSDLLLGALDIAKITTTGYAPATLTEDPETFAIKAAAPVTALTGEFTGSSFNATKVNTAGGATMTTTKKNAATTGGSLTVTNLTVDLTTKSIYADLIGGNNVGTVTQQKVWNFANLEGATDFATTDGVHTSVNKLTGLTITTEAFDIFAKSLGLTNFGKTSMAGIEDYGVIDSTISVTTTAVPEPSAYALLVAGLAAVGFAAKRRRAA